MLLEWLRLLVVASVRRRFSDLTLRQEAVLLSVYLDDEKHTVRGLARSLRVSRPAISRALDRLGELGFTRRQPDPTDRRSVVVRRTRKGAERIRMLTDLLQKSYDGARNPRASAVQQEHHLVAPGKAEPLARNVGKQAGYSLARKELV